MLTKRNQSRSDPVLELLEARGDRLLCIGKALVRLDGFRDAGKVRLSRELACVLELTQLRRILRAERLFQQLLEDRYLSKRFLDVRPFEALREDLLNVADELAWIFQREDRIQAA